MVAFADTGFIASLYLEESTSKAADAALGTKRVPLPLTPLAALELRNAFNRAVQRQRITAAQRDALWQDVEADIDELVTPSPIGPERQERAVWVLNKVLLPAMKEVGDKFGAGELILPFVLQSAEVMKKTVAHLETYLERKEGTSKGKLVLATVYGDVHDIGKNLVKTILSNNGYDVVDLGKQVPAETIISKAVEEKADAIGLSALLVSTSKQMPLVVNELQRRGLKFPVLIGGAAINERFGRRILCTETDELYAPGVFYCKDAFEGLATMDVLSDPETRKAALQKLKEDSDFEFSRSTGNVSGNEKERKSAVSPAPFIPNPSQWGVHVVQQMPLEVIFKHLAKNELFRLSWGAKNTHGEDWTKLQQEYEARLERMCKGAIQEKWLAPRGIYGFWPAQVENSEDLLVYDPASIKAAKPTVLAKFHFPRQKAQEALSLADYFLPVESGKMDTVAFQIVTVGQAATERFDRLQAANDYSEAYFTHGLAVQTAEAAADYLHEHVRRELGIPVTVKKIGGESRYLLPDELAEMVRWIDMLDRM